MVDKNRGIEVTIRMGDIEETRRMITKWDPVENADLLVMKGPASNLELIDAVVEQVTDGFKTMLSDILHDQFIKEYERLHGRDSKPRGEG